MLQPDLIEEVLQTLGGVLEARGLSYEVVVIGGSALLLHGIILRPTVDLDLLAIVYEGRYRTAEPLPEPLVQAARDVAAQFGLSASWLNPGPTSLLQLGLPEGFHNRVETREYGPLIVHIAGRLDLINLKLYAAASYWPHERKHIDDLRRLTPTVDELSAAARWARAQDPSEFFARLLLEVLQLFGVDDAAS